MRSLFLFVISSEDCNRSCLDVIETLSREGEDIELMQKGLWQVN